MVAQTTYTKNIRQAIAGQVAYDFGTADITSHNVVESVIPFGVAVQRGLAANDNSVRIGGTNVLTDATVIGFTVRSLLQQNAVNNNLTSYAVTETAGVIRKGYIFVTNTGTAAIAEGEAIRINNATGAVTGDAAGGAIIALTDVFAEQDAAAGAICLIRIDK